MGQELEYEIENVLELADTVYGCEPPDEKSARGTLRKCLYKYTSCGAFIEFLDDGVVIGSIVEGVDWGTDNHTLHYPFTNTEFWEAVESVEEEASQIWDETHGCEDCGDENPETGNIHVRPDCPTCGGHGIVI
jgi:hypothetical protein